MLNKFIRFLIVLCNIAFYEGAGSASMLSLPSTTENENILGGLKSELLLSNNIKEVEVHSIQECYQNEPGVYFLDITSILSESDLNMGCTPRAFPLPNGKTRGKIQFMRIGDQLTKVKMKSEVGDNGGIKIWFISCDEKGNELRLSKWRWNKTSRKFVFKGKIENKFDGRHSKIAELYKVSGELDVTSILSEESLSSGKISRSFPLPNGRTWSKPQRMRIGDQLTKVKMKSEVGDNGGIKIWFISFNKEDNELCRSEWRWNKTSRKFVFKGKIENKFDGRYSKIAELYKVSGELDVTSILSEESLSSGQIPRSFPLPNGKTWSKQQRMRIGKQLTKVKMKSEVGDNGGIKIWFISCDEKGDELRLSKWRWSKTSGKLIFKKKIDGSSSNLVKNSITAGLRQLPSKGIVVETATSQ